MLDIMQATGLEKGGIYRHFRNKEELAAAAFEHSLTVSLDVCLDGLQEVPGAAVKLRHCIDRFVEVIPKLRGGCPLLNAAVDSDDGNPALRNLVRTAFSRWRKSLRRVLVDGIANGEIRPETDAAMIVDTVMASLEGAIVLSRILRDPRPIKNAEKMLARIIDSIRTAHNVDA